MMWTPDYFVYLMDFPAHIGGISVPNDDATFDIYINANISERRQQEALAHELNHIREDHFYRPICAMQAEAELRSGKRLDAEFAAPMPTPPAPTPTPPAPEEPPPPEEPPAPAEPKPYDIPAPRVVGNWKVLALTNLSQMTKLFMESSTYIEVFGDKPPAHKKGAVNG